jgi:hypothetical protein
MVLALGVGLPASGAPGARNLVLTSAVRQALVDVGARSHGLRAKDYLGLEKGTAYYAYDAANKTYYAAASLKPSPASMQAEIAAQDDGAYNLFTRASNTSKWTIYDDGLTGGDGARCPITIPAAVRHVWGWTRACQPPQAV